MLVSVILMDVQNPSCVVNDSGMEFHTQDKNSKETGCQQAADKLPVLYLILGAGAGIDAGVGRTYGVWDF